MMMLEIAAGLAIFAGCLALSAAGIMMWTGFNGNAYIKDGDLDGSGKEAHERGTKESGPPEAG